MASWKRGTSVESPNEVHLRRQDVVVVFGDGRAKPPVGQEVILGQQPKARTHFPDARQVEHQHSGLVTPVTELVLLEEKLAFPLVQLVKEAEK